MYLNAFLYLFVLTTNEEDVQIVIGSNQCATALSYLKTLEQSS